MTVAGTIRATMKENDMSRKKPVQKVRTPKIRVTSHGKPPLSAAAEFARLLLEVMRRG